ncbi:NF038132 family protein [Paracoccus sp. WLY502]|uniref:NF038132 family protein n=1 Tax=Paracoccus yibinensis TaxID=3068891 RepID=UPI0027967C77|nr:NF038132 family protein [Paracoccus sp. WLY502]MDQ1899169.1 NF038132 family protein [Paracoccus sp. WLY502]
MIRTFLTTAAATALLAVGAHAATLPSGWTAEGNAGTGSPNGVVSAPPAQGPGYYYVSTAGGVTGGGSLPGVGGTGVARNGSNVITAAFTAAVGDVLEFYFNYVTSDGAGFADYGWSRLLDATTSDEVALLFTARTTPTGSSVPGFGMPAPAATLDPVSVDIQDGATFWDVLGSSSGTCYIAIGEGCGATGWVKSTYTITEAGSYTLQFGVTNWNDTAFDSGMAFAGAKIGDVIITPPVDPAAVPLPASALLLGAGIGAMGVMRRRQKAQA